VTDPDLCPHSGYPRSIGGGGGDCPGAPGTCRDNASYYATIPFTWYPRNYFPNKLAIPQYIAQTEPSRASSNSKYTGTIDSRKPALLNMYVVALKSRAICDVIDLGVNAAYRARF
jgi:hypothetical protein